MPRLAIIVASTRPGRVGRDIAEWFHLHAANHGGFDLDLVDLAEIGLPFLDEPEEASTRVYTHQHTKDWSARVEAADAFVFVMPEYNNGFNAPLKNALDFLYYEWQYKPVSFVSYGMTSAGLRAVQMIKQVVAALKMMPVAEAVSVPLRQCLDENGRLMPNDIMTALATEMLDELERLTTAFGTIRAAVGG
jgi:NAD(P)H-dependent FMN reductase